MRLRLHRRNLVVWSQSAGPADRDGAVRLVRTGRIRRPIRIVFLLTVVGLLRLARANWARCLLAGAVLTVVGLVHRGGWGSVVLLPGLLLLLSAPLIPGAPPGDRVRHSKLERELAVYTTTRQRFDLGATLDQYPDGVTHELRDILARQATAAAYPPIPGCGRR